MTKGAGVKLFRLQTFENSSILLKFHVFFVLMTIIPVGVLMYLYAQLEDSGAIDLTVDQLNITLIIVTLGVAVGYVAMRLMLKNLIDVTNASMARLGQVLGPEKIQDYLKGSENEIEVLTKTFGEVTHRLEENVQTLELTKKTLQSVLTRVGHGISSMGSLDTFLDLIVETTTEAMFGRKGILLLLDEDKKTLRVKAVCGISSRVFAKNGFSAETGIFAPVLLNRSALILSKTHYHVDSAEGEDGLDFPMMCAPLLFGDNVQGVLVISGRKEGSNFRNEEMDLLTNLAGQTAVAIENSLLSKNQDRAYFETLAALAMAVEAKDPYARGHLERVADLSARIAQALEVDQQLAAHLRDAARLHDLGKIGIADEILAKPSSLTDQELAMMRRHPEIGEGIIRPIPSLQPLCDIVRHHHEMLDGSGYPDGLRAEQISLAARILCAVNIYDDLVMDRPHRRAMSRAEAVAELRSMDAKLDQRVVEVLAGLV